MAYTKLIKAYIEDKSKTRKDYSCSVAFYMYIFIAFICLFGAIMVFEFFTRVTLQWTFFALKYFTTLSGFAMGIVAFMMAILFGLLKHGKIQRIRKGFSIVNLVFTSCTTLTMIVTIFILTPYSVMYPEAVTTYSLYTWSNLLFHVIVPVLSFVTFLFYAKTCEIKIVESLFTMIPGISYLIFYVLEAVMHKTYEGGFQEGYDWYGFLRLGTWPAIGIGFLIMGILFGVSCLLSYGNKKIEVDKFFIDIFMLAFTSILIIVGTFWSKQGQTWWEMFKYFESFMSWVLLAAIIAYIVYAAKIKRNKAKVVPNWVSKMQIASISCLVMVFMLGTFNYLPIFIIKGMYDDCALFTDSGLYFRFLVPAFALFTYMAFEHNELKFKQVLYGMIAPVLYSIMYIILVYVYKGSELDPKYWDWYRVYRFFNNIHIMWVAPVITAAVTLLSSFIAWIGNKKMYLSQVKQYIKK